MTADAANPEPVTLDPVGVVRSSRAVPEDDGWDAVDAAVELDGDRFGPDALRGLDAFSHVEVVFLMDRVDPASVETAARHPRNRADWPEVGIFAQRAKRRPNRLGVSRCAVLDVAGLTVRVRGLDAVEGTPVLDLKPYVREFGPRGEVTQPDWASELMRDYF